MNKCTVISWRCGQCRAWVPVEYISHVHAGRLEALPCVAHGDPISMEARVTASVYWRKAADPVLIREVLE